MEELNQHEEQIMSFFWDQGELLIKEVLDQLPEPKPVYTTLASTIRNIERKGYLTHRMYGTVNIYKPTVSKDDYSKKSINRYVDIFFGGSIRNFLSFLVEEKNITKKEVKELQTLINQLDKPEES